jgi:hypothetical protein
MRSKQNINLSKEHAHKKVSYGEEDAIMLVSQASKQASKQASRQAGR